MCVCECECVCVCVCVCTYVGMCECEYVKEIMRKKMTTPDHFLCGCTVHSLKCFVSALPSFVTLNWSVCVYVCMRFVDLSVEAKLILK